MDYDVIVVGGSFAGLTNAYFLAKEGLKVCVFERRKIGEFTKSTGILTQSVIDDLNVPKKLIENEIDKFFLYSPSMKKYEYKFDKPLFFPSDTLNFLGWLKREVKRLGVDINENVNCKKIKINDSCVQCENIKGKLIIFACGILPKQFQYINKKKIDYYVGLEYIAEGINVEDKNAWQIYFDQNISPGYFCWITPVNRKIAHVGLLKRTNDYVSSQVSMNRFLKKINSKLSKTYETRTGLVPLSGPIEKTYGNRFIVTGDAAGHTGAFSSGGINYATRIAKITSKTISDCIDNSSEDELSRYEKLWKNEIGDRLNHEILLRRMFDKLNTNDKIEKVLKLLNHADRKRILKTLEDFTNLEGNILKDVFLLFI